MATYDYTCTTAWASAQAGEKTLNLCNNDNVRIIEYRTGTTTPASTVVGVELHPGCTHPVYVASGSNLYLRAKNGSGSVTVTAVDGAA